MRVLWAAMVYQNDFKHLKKYIESILGCSVEPSRIVIIDAGSDQRIRAIVRSFSNKSLEYFSLGDTVSNRGFNPSFNFSVKYAVENGYDWLATMTVRAVPDKSWLENSLKPTLFDSRIGMVTTLQLRKTREDKIYSIGHFLSPSGGLYDYAKGSQIEELDKIAYTLQKEDFYPIWSACCGGAIYNVRALSIASRSISDDYSVFHPNGFKSYNCSHLGYLLRAHGFKNVVAHQAVCVRDDSESTSRHPSSCGLLVNQEINRVASLRTFWPKELAQRAVAQYLSEDRKKTKLSALDKRVIVTLAENLKRNWPDKRKIRKTLVRHLQYFPRSIQAISSL